MVDPLTTSAISWGFSAASWLISPALSRFLNKCFDALGMDPQFQSRKQVLHVKLEQLQTTLLPQLLILTDAAQHSPHRRFLDKWLQKLKSAFYEAEHELGLIEYQRLEKEVNSLLPSSSKFNLNKLKGKLPKFSSEHKNLIKSLKNIEEIVNEAINFVSLLNLPSSSGKSSTSSSRETTSIPPTKVIGRDEERNHIVKLLREDISESTSDARSYSVIGIWGMGGSGKTTLAQYVCAHEKEKKMGELKKYFDPIMWVYVSEKFSVHVIMMKIWESASNSSCPNYANLDVLMSKVADKLRGKRFLLVLDDVWWDKGISEQELEQLFAPLRAGKRGSKVLVTTRNEAAARALGAMDLIKLPELTDEAFFSLFMSHGLSGVKVNEHMEKILLKIGEKILGKLCRLPLAAIAVAGQLRRRKDPEFWLSMLSNSLLQDRKDIMKVLHLSYQHLPPALQRCFAFCSLFPKGHQFKHDHLVNLWIAEGFIETEDSNEHVKDIANQYILELISSSFFQIVECNSKLYSMHDLMHDLAQYVSEGEYFRIEWGEKKEIPDHTRHIFVVDHMLGEYVEKICKLKYLRTIIAFRSYSKTSLLQEVDLDALFRMSRNLFVVEIEGPDFNEVPKSVIHLRNLRYLNLGTVKESVLLIPLNRLYQLRTLCISSKISNVGRLISLQNLKEFDVRMQRGFELKQLEHLKNLYGSLSIYGLKDVQSKEEADRAKLSDKKGLRKLLFSWDHENRDVLRDMDDEILDGLSRDMDDEILYGLSPPPQIKELAIKGYNGKRFPNWISENNLTHVTLLRLEDIITITCIPEEVFSSLISLQNLHINGCLLLRSIRGWDTHSTLEEFYISSCPNLILKTSLVVASSSDTVEFSSSSSRWGIRYSVLKCVFLENCMPSDDMLQGLVSLERLHVWDCPTIVNPHIGHLNKLNLLVLQNCPNLASLRGLNELNNLERLEVLFGCEELKCSSDVDKLPQLGELRISRLSLLEQLVSGDGFSFLISLQLHYAQQEYFSPEECEVFCYLSSLSEIRFYRCKMRSLPNLLCLHSLRYLNICYCENLSSLPDVPPSVQWIEIYHCNEEFTRSCKDPNHPNWDKISNIPDKSIE